MSSRSIPILAAVVLLSDLCLRPAAGRLVAHYQLDDGRGSAVADSSGNGHDGTLIGSGASWVDGPTGSGKALHFPGTAPSPFVSTGRWDPSANTDRLTVAVWIK